MPKGMTLQPVILRVTDDMANIKVPDGVRDRKKQAQPLEMSVVYTGSGFAFIEELSHRDHDNDSSEKRNSNRVVVEHRSNSKACHQRA